jgi:NADP-dependent aldehyde dehydrogenase
VFAEMGSVNPVILTQNALKARASEIAQTYADSITLGVGQFCTNPGLILGVASDSFKSFYEELSKKLEVIDEACMLHPNIQDAYLKGEHNMIHDTAIKMFTSIKSNTPNHVGPTVAITTGEDFLKNPKLHQEVFGPFSLVVQCEDDAQLLEIISKLEGQLTGTIIAQEEDYKDLSPLVERLQNRVGRIVFNGVPTGVAVADAMTHGGPYPASTDSRFTAVGNQAIKRWVRPFSFQDFPEELLPEFLKK